MEGILNTVLPWLKSNGPNIMYAVLILLAGKFISKWTGGLVRKILDKAKVDGTVSKFMASLASISLMAFFVIAALSKLGIAVSSFVAVLAAAGFAIGLALQGSLSNFAAGVMLLLFRPFKAGDYVEAGGCAGLVEEVNIFNTMLKSPDNRRIIVPNSKITSDSITNYTAMKTRRLDLVFGIGYGDDIKKAKNVIDEILSKNERVLKDPAPTVGVLELADSSVNFAVRPWVNTSDYWDAFFDLKEKIKIAFDDNGISIPFPQTDVHFYPTKAGTKVDGVNAKEITQ